MNGPQPASEICDRPDMRAALAARDIATVYRILQRYGWSQRRIAAVTGQSQSEISEILVGRRVVSYDVLCRIADGLGVERGLMGLAYASDPASEQDGQPEPNGKSRPRVIVTISIEARTPSEHAAIEPLLRQALSSRGQPIAQSEIV